MKTFIIHLGQKSGDKELLLSVSYEVPIAYLGTVMGYLEKWRKPKHKGIVGPKDGAKPRRML